MEEHSPDGGRLTDWHDWIADIAIRRSPPVSSHKDVLSAQHNVFIIRGLYNQLWCPTPVHQIKHWASVETWEYPLPSCLPANDPSFPPKKPAIPTVQLADVTECLVEGPKGQDLEPPDGMSKAPEPSHRNLPPTLGAVCMQKNPPNTFPLPFL